jgi:hypothetical protein
MVPFDWAQDRQQVVKKLLSGKWFPSTGLRTGLGRLFFMLFFI